MALINETDKYVQWRYSIAEFIVLYPTSTYPIPTERVTALSIIHDYEKNLFPIFKIEFVLESSVYYEIMKNKNTVKFKLRVQKFSKERGKETKSLYRDYINTTFSLIMDDDPNDNYNIGEAIGDDKNQLDQVDNRIELFLFKEETVNAMKTNVNAVMTSASMAGAIGYIISKSGLNGKMLMTPPENGNRYNELIIPPQNALSAIQYLDTTYGLYSKGSMIYFDFDYGYILNYAGGCTAYIKDEIQDVCIIVPEDNTAASTDSGMLEKVNQKTRMYIIAQQSFMEMQNQSISNDVINGNNATVVNSSQSTISNVSSSAISKTGGNSKIIQNNTQNAWFGQTYAAQTSANSIVIPLALGDIDLAAIRPNKKFVFIFENSILNNKYRGIYIIASSIIKFIHDGADFSVEVNVTFKRVGDDPVITETYTT